MLAEVSRPSIEHAVTILILSFLVHAVVAGVLSAPIVVLGRRRAGWKPWELLGLVVPFVFWFLLYLLVHEKPFNVGDFLVMSVATPLAVGVRVGMGRDRYSWLGSLALIVALCVVVLGAYVAIPAIGLRH